MKLAKRTVEALRPDSERQLFFYDDRLPGFGVRVSPGGTKSYFVQYRNRHRRSRRYTLGRHGVLTAEHARRMAREALVAVAEGRDPQTERRLAREQVTVSGLADMYLERHAKIYKKPSSVRNDRQKLTNHILPRLGGRAVPDVGAEDVGKLHQSLVDTPHQANHVLALLSKMFSLAEQWGLRPPSTNPCRYVERYRAEGRERYLSAEEFRRLGEVLRRVETEQTEKPQAVLAIRMIMLTGCRLNEILSLKWEHVDLERGELRLAASKTGKKVVTLSTAAQDLLHRAARESEWVIPSPTTEGHWAELRGPWSRIKARVTDDQVDISDVRLHDLRHSFASVAAGQGIGLQLVGKLLGHTQTATTERYAHLADDPVRQAANRIGAEIAAVLGDEEGGEVRRLG